jgi:peptide/nickel transport system substrate-binding protein
MEAESTVNTYSFPRPYYVSLVFSTRHPILKRPEVRVAINEALDRAAIVKDGLRGRGEPAEGPFWPQHWAYPGPRQGFTYDPQSAKARLDAAGLPVRRHPDGTPKRFSFSCVMFANDSRFDRIAATVQKQLADVGIDMKLIAVPQSELEKTALAGNFDAFIFEFAGRALSWTYGFWRSGQRLNTGYTSGDALLDRMRTARSDDEVKAAAVELAQLFRRDPPAAFLAWQETTRVVSTGFDVGAETGRDIFTSIWQWRRAREPRKLTAH